MRRHLISLLLIPSLAACGGVPDIRRAPAPPPAPIVTSETAYAPQLAQSQLAGREIVRLRRAASVGEPEPMSDAAKRAVRAALAEDVLRCTDEVDAVALEGDVLGGPGAGLIAVYLVPLAQAADAVPLGGFHRITVDAASGRVVHRAAMTQTCRNLSLRPAEATPDDARVRSLFVTHALTPYPLESHVYTSLTSAVDLVVSTPTATWRVSEGRISALD